MLSIKTYPGLVDTAQFLSNEEVEKVHKYSEKLTFEPGTTHGGMGPSPVEGEVAIRSCDVKWIDPSEEIHWLFKGIHEEITFVNSNYFHYDLLSTESLQYTVYNENSSWYGQHNDVFPLAALHRKISFTVQLSDDDEYEGGDLLIYPHSFKRPHRAQRKKGSITIFQSNLIHEVTPVTKGVRKSLVGWFSGPPLK